MFLEHHNLKAHRLFVVQYQQQGQAEQIMCGLTQLLAVPLPWGLGIILVFLVTQQGLLVFPRSYK